MRFHGSEEEVCTLLPPSSPSRPRSLPAPLLGGGFDEEASDGPPPPWLSGLFAAPRSAERWRLAGGCDGGLGGFEEGEEEESIGVSRLRSALRGGLLLVGLASGLAAAACWALPERGPPAAGAGAASAAAAASAGRLRPLRFVSPGDLEVKEAVREAGTVGAQDLVGDGYGVLGCPDAVALNDFSSLQGMERAGWWFNWTDDFVFKPSIYRDFAPPDSYWGFSLRGYAAITLRLTGSGVATIDFGNLLGTPGSRVSVLLNREHQGHAASSTLSRVVEVPFEQEDALSIVENPRGIIVINSISIRCTAASAAGPHAEDDGVARPKGVADAEAYWKTQYKALQDEAQNAKHMDKEHFAMAQKKRFIADMAVEDWKQVQALERRQQEGAARARLEVSSQKQDNERLAGALEALATSPASKERLQTLVSMPMLSPDDKGDTDAVRLERRSLDEAMKEEMLAREVEMEAQQAGRPGEGEQAEILVQQAQEQERRQRQELGELMNVSVLLAAFRRNETWALNQLAVVSKKERGISAQLASSEQREEGLEVEEARAADRVKQAMAAEEAARSEAASHSEQDLVTETTTTITTWDSRPLLYCFTLVLPFGYEPGLLAKQKERAVGIFACDGYDVFSNTSQLLDDTGSPFPVAVKTVDCSLSVPYGGKWHTALNTGVFNRLWEEVVQQGTYLNFDWIVKADADTVFFPDRLVEVLRRGLTPGLVREAIRKRRKLRRLQEELPARSTCRLCRLPGHETESCAEHAAWLQESQRLTCDEALAQIRREPPLDCGCECDRLEACDLTGDLAWSSDGGFILGEDLEEATDTGVMDLGHIPLYLNNCRYGLHGPIEVLTAAAVTVYVEGLPRCASLLDQPWGEDKYLDRCMLRLGVSRANVFSLLDETACNENPAPCGSAAVAFHPFKTVQDYFACWIFAHAYGHGPASVEEVPIDGHLLAFGSAPLEPTYAVGSSGVPSDRFV